MLFDRHTYKNFKLRSTAAMKNTLALLAFFLCFSFGLQATHFLGFTMTYEQRGGDTLRVHQYEYVECTGVAIAPIWQTTVTSASACPTPPSGPTMLISSMEITPICPSVQTTCQNSSSMIYGLWEVHQARDYDLAGQTCSEYIMRYSNCCRNAATTNIQGNSSIQVDTKVTLAGYSQTNSSPQWRSIFPRSLYTAGPVNITYDFGATDPDGDSLVYSFAVPQGTGGPVSYNVGYSLTNPIGPNYSVTIDPETGFANVQSSTGMFFVAVMVVVVEEFRNGVKLGEVHQEFSLFSFNFPQGAPSNPPTVSGMVGVQGGYQFGDTAVIPMGGTSCIDVQADDIDAGDISELKAYYFDDASPYYLADTNNLAASSVYGEDPIGRFCINPLAEGEFEFYISARDSLCNNVALDIAKYTFIVGDTGKVWPGDANNDLIANNLDLLALGLAFGNTGPARPGASNNWVGQPAIPWQDTIAGGVEQKYQDSDGNGTVNADDTLAIILNYGLTHNKTGGVNGGGGDPPLRIEFPADSFQVGDTIHAPIYLGDSSIMAQNVYGIAFTVNYDETLIDSASFSISFNNNWMGTAPNELDLSYDHWALGKCDAAYVRTDQQVATGMGQIATATFVIIDNIDGKKETLVTDTLSLAFSDVTLIGLDGLAIPVNAIDDDAIVFESILDQGPPSIAQDIFVYPNPASRFVRVRTESAPMLGLEMVDMQGRLVFQDHTEAMEYRLDTELVPAGLYFLRIQTNEGTITRKLLVE